MLITYVLVVYNLDKLTSLLRSGTNSAHAAELEVTSVNNDAITEHNKQITQASQPSTILARLLATQSENPDSSEAAAIAYPPPININTPHPVFL